MNNETIRNQKEPDNFPALFYPVLGLFLALPRLVRILSPNVQIEDPNYIYGAFLVSIGLKPFQDFAQPNPPFLESLLAAGYSLFGVSYRLPEYLTACVYFLTAWVIYLFASRYFDRISGMIASLLFSFHYLTFRYHLFEREVYATFFIWSGLLILLDSNNRRWHDGLAGILFGIGYLCKQTALISFLPVLGVVWFFHGRFWKGIKFLSGYALVIGLSTGLYYWLYGEDYIRQTFWFHFIKGSVGSWYIKAIWTLSGLGFLWPLMAGQIPLIRFSRKDPSIVLWALVGSDLAFFWFFTGAYWPHYLLSTLVPVSILAGHAVRSWTAMPATSKYNCYRRIMSISAAAGLTFILVWVNPRILSGEGAAEKWGFAGSKRSDTVACAEFLGIHTSLKDIIVADPFIGLLSERIIAVRFEDNWGLMLWMNAMMDEGIYFKELKMLKNATFGEVRRLSHLFWESDLQAALMQQEFAAVLLSYEYGLSAGFLESCGYRQKMKNSTCEIFLPENLVIPSEQSDPFTNPR